MGPNSAFFAPEEVWLALLLMARCLGALRRFSRYGGGNLSCDFRSGLSFEDLENVSWRAVVFEAKVLVNHAH